MTERIEPPRLFVWGGHGVPGEFESYLKSLETSARLDRGEREEAHTIGFAGEGVHLAAIELLDRLRSERLGFLDKKRKTSYEVNHPVSQDIRSMAFLLHAYCAKWNKPAPPALLWLTLEVLGLKEGRPAPEVERLLHLDAGILDRDAFHYASALDGEADAAGTEWKVSHLAKKVGVSRDTLRRWRKMQNYQSRRDFVAYLEGKPQPDYGWGEAVKRAKAESRCGGDGKV